MSDYLTVAEVANILRVNETTIRRWIERGMLEAIHLPATGTRMTYRIPKRALARILGESL